VGTTEVAAGEIGVEEVLGRAGGGLDGFTGSVSIDSDPLVSPTVSEIFPNLNTGGVSGSGSGSSWTDVRLGGGGGR